MLPDSFINLLTIRPAMITLLELEIPQGALTFLEKLPSEVVLPNLEALAVKPSAENLDLEEGWLLWPESVRVFESASKLEFVTMTVQVEGFNPTSLHLPWHQLKDLSLNSPPSSFHIPCNNIRSILRKCTVLEQFSVSLDTRSIEVDLNDVITLPHLEILAITINHTLGIHFFECVDLPQLRTLALFIFPPSGFLVDLQPLADSQRASNFSLTRLALIYINVEQEDLLEILRLMPSLKDASLTFVSGLDEVFFSALQDNNPDTALIPCLSALSTDCSSFPLPHLQSILESRGYPGDLSTSNSPTVAKLKSLTLVVEANFDQSVFENFVGRGLALTLDRVIGRQPTPESESESEEPE